MFFKKNSGAKSSPSLDKSETSTQPKPETRLQNAVAEEDPDMDPVEGTVTQDVEYPTGLKLALIIFSLFASMFLVSLDRLIITTAIPRITDEFNSVTDIGWYGSAFLLTTCAFQLLFGKLYYTYSIKVVFMTSVVLFEVGSAVCGAAPSSTALITGRAIAGIGGAGIFSGGITVIAYTIPLSKRPLYQGMFGAVFGIASVVGPLLGGVFTTKVTWRWCFYINLPLGVVALVVTAFLLQIPGRDSTKIPSREKLAQLDFYGTALIVPGSVCLVLALQWGGLKYPWDNGRVVALLVVAGLLLIGFALVQAFLPKTATLPPRIFLQRSILAGFIFAFFTGSHMMLFTYYLPIWFQAIKGYSAVDSGIRSLPIVLPMVAASILAGVLTKITGYYTPFMIAGVCFVSVGGGLLNTLQVDTPQAKWIGYQLLYGFGMGCSFQGPNLAAQTVLRKRDVSIGTSLMFFSQLLGGAIFVSVGQNVLNNELSKRLSSLPGFDAEKVQSSGATSLTNLPDSIKPKVLREYNESLRKVFQVGLIMACLSIFGALLMEWRSVKEEEKKGKTKSEQAGIAGVEGDLESGEKEKTGRDVLGDGSSLNSREKKNGH